MLGKSRYLFTTTTVLHVPYTSMLTVGPLERFNVDGQGGHMKMPKVVYRDLTSGR